MQLKKFLRLFSFVFFLYVLLLEMSTSGLMAFAGTDAEQLWFPLCLFGAMAVGNGIGVFQKTKLNFIKNSFHILGIPLLVCLVGLRFFPEMRFLWLSLPLVAIGLMTSMMYVHFELWDLVVGFGVAGMFFYGSKTLFPRYLSEYQLIGLVVCLLIIFLVSSRKIIELVLAGVVGIGFWTFLQLGYFDIPSRLQQVAPQFKGAVQLASPRFTDLFRSDFLYLPRPGMALIMVNGQRFAVLPNEIRVNDTIEKNEIFITSYDSPYVLMQPKRTLVIGPAEGGNVISALKNKVPEVWTVDINPSMYDFSLSEARSITGGFYDRPQIRNFVAEGRSFLESTSQSFDLITLQGVQTGSVPTRESTTVIESFLFTQEAVQSLWSRLSATGMIYFDEYQRPHTEQDADTPSLLNTLATSAKKILPLQDPDRQVRLISYLQAYRNPKSSKNLRARREALFISRIPISDDKMAALANKIGKGFAIETISKENQFGAIVDNRPNFILATMASKVPILAFLGLFMLIASISLSRFQKDKVAGINLVLLGVIHMLFIMAISGPAVLMLGHPSHVVPVVYGGLLAGSVFGAWAALKLKSSILLRLDFVILSLFIGAMIGLLSTMRPGWFATSAIHWQFGLFFILSVAFGIVVEIPYMRLLAEVEGQDRAFRFFVENLGALSGVPLGLLIQIYFGSTGSLTGALGLAVTLLIINLVLKRPGFSKT